jgi:hypothetical protein
LPCIPATRSPGEQQIQFNPFANCTDFNIQEVYSDLLANTEDSDTAKAEGSLAVSYPLDSLAKAKGSCSVIPVENGRDHMLISSNDNQEMQVSQTEGFG